jgi:hypothetical protein
MILSRAPFRRLQPNPASAPTTRPVVKSTSEFEAQHRDPKGLPRS